MVIQFLDDEDRPAAVNLYLFRIMQIDPVDRVEHYEPVRKGYLLKIWVDDRLHEFFYRTEAKCLRAYDAIVRQFNAALAQHNKDQIDYRPSIFESR